MVLVSILQMLGGGVLPGMVMIRALVDARAGVVETRSVAVSVDLLQERLPTAWDLALPFFDLQLEWCAQQQASTCVISFNGRLMNGSLTRCTV